MIYPNLLVLSCIYNSCIHSINEEKVCFWSVNMFLSPVCGLDSIITWTWLFWTEPTVWSKVQGFSKIHWRTGPNQTLLSLSPIKANDKDEDLPVVYTRYTLKPKTRNMFLVSGSHHTLIFHSPSSRSSLGSSWLLSKSAYLHPNKKVLSLSVLPNMRFWVSVMINHAAQIETILSQPGSSLLWVMCTPQLEAMGQGKAWDVWKPWAMSLGCGSKYLLGRARTP